MEGKMKKMVAAIFAAWFLYFFEIASAEFTLVGEKFSGFASSGWESQYVFSIGLKAWIHRGAGRSFLSYMRTLEFTQVRPFLKVRRKDLMVGTIKISILVLFGPPGFINSMPSSAIFGSLQRDR